MTQIKRTYGAQIVTTTNTYDSSGRLTQIAHPSIGGTYTYTFDALDRITRQVNSDGTSDYTYDANDQLLSATGESAYSYDNNGNRTMAGYSSGTDNRLVSEGGWTYTYDNCGNMIGRTNGTNTWVYAWDQRNRLTQAALNGTQTVITYRYDPSNERISYVVKNSGVTVTNEREIRENGCLVANTANGSLWTRFLTTPQVNGILAQIELGGQVKWALKDHQETVRDVMDASTLQRVGVHTKFDTYGNVLSGGGGTRLWYTGQQLDIASGLYYFHARYYLSRIGRFMSQDPIGCDGGDGNLYRYVGNNVTNLSDPTGLCANGGTNYSVSGGYSLYTASSWGSSLASSGNIGFSDHLPSYTSYGSVSSFNPSNPLGIQLSERYAPANEYGTVSDDPHTNAAVAALREELQVSNLGWASRVTSHTLNTASLGATDSLGWTRSSYISSVMGRSAPLQNIFEQGVGFAAGTAIQGAAFKAITYGAGAVASTVMRTSKTVARGSVALIWTMAGPSAARSCLLSSDSTRQGAKRHRCLFRMALQR